MIVIDIAVLSSIILIILAVAAYVLTNQRRRASNTNQPKERILLYIIGNTGNTKTLSTECEAQARKTARFLLRKDLHGCKIYSSHAGKALVTANIIANKLGVNDVISDSRLENVNYGDIHDFTPETHPFLFRKYKKICEDFKKDHDHVYQILNYADLESKLHKEFGSGTTMDAIQRVQNFLYNVHEDAVAVMHINMMQIIIEALTGIHEKIEGDMSNGKNTAMMLIARDIDDRKNWRVLMLPNTNHL